MSDWIFYVVGCDRRYHWTKRFLGSCDERGWLSDEINLLGSVHSSGTVDAWGGCRPLFTVMVSMVELVVC